MEYSRTVSIAKIIRVFVRNMAFSVVQTRKTKKSKPSLTIVPSKWVNNGNVSWPPRNFISLSTDEHSFPDECTWTKQACKTVGRAKTYREAEDIVNKLEMVTDSEDAVDMTRGTRGKPGKKKLKFEENIMIWHHRKSKLLW